MEVTFKKPDSTDVAEQIKPVYNTIVAEEQFWFPEFRLQSQSFFCTNISWFCQQQNVKDTKVYKRPPPYLTHIGDSIDQGATRLGGYRSVFMFADGGSSFSLCVFRRKLLINKVC